jgi:hypothetical protein
MVSQDPAGRAGSGNVLPDSCHFFPECWPPYAVPPPPGSCSCVARAGSICRHSPGGWEPAPKRKPDVPVLKSDISVPTSLTKVWIVIILTPSIRVRSTPQMRFNSAVKSKPDGWFLRAFLAARCGLFFPSLGSWIPGLPGVSSSTLPGAARRLGISASRVCNLWSHYRICCWQKSYRSTTCFNSNRSSSRQVPSRLRAISSRLACTR